jgi:hypothetical protein
MQQAKFILNAGTEPSSVTCYECLSHKLSVLGSCVQLTTSEENHENPQSAWPASGLSFESETLKILSRNSNLEYVC